MHSDDPFALIWEDEEEKESGQLSPPALDPGQKEDTFAEGDAEPTRVGRGVKPYRKIVNGKDRDQWLAQRRTQQGLGASDAATIMGLNAYESAYTLYQKLIGNIPVDDDNKHMEWGRRLEDVIAQKFSDDTGRIVLPVNGRSNVGGWLCRSTKYPWLYATPDREQVADQQHGVLEVKTGGHYMIDDWKEQPPLGYQAQVQQQMVVTGLRRASICVLLGGKDFFWADVPFHARFCSALVAKSKEFWRRVQERDEPVPDPSPSTSSTLRHMIAEGVAIELPDPVLAWHEQAEQAAADEKEARERKEQYRRMIEATMGSAAYGVLPAPVFGANGVYKFANEHRKAYTVEHAETNNRVLRFKKRLVL